MKKARLTLTAATIIYATGCGAADVARERVDPGMPSTDINVAVGPTMSPGRLERSGSTAAADPRRAAVGVPTDQTAQVRPGALSVCNGKATITPSGSWDADLAGDFTLAFGLRAMTSDRLILDAGRLKIRLAQGRLEVNWGDERFVGPEVSDGAAHHVTVARNASGVALYHGGKLYFARRYRSFAAPASWPPARIVLGANKPGGCVVIDDLKLASGAPTTAVLPPEDRAIASGPQAVFAYDFDGDAADRSGRGCRLSMAGSAAQVFIN